jgi:ribosomal protein S18 acetylase RimI-like enzyme
VRPGGPDDAPAAALLHAGRITEGFLSLLGPAFLGRLYRRIALAPESFLLVATTSGRTVGFIAGSADIARLYRTFLWRDGPMAVLVAWRRLATGWRRVVETLRHATPAGAGTGRGTELLAIAVEDGWQGLGVGGQLVAAFLDEVADRGGTAAYVVVGAANHGAVALYRRAGFLEGAHFELHPGTESVLMQWDRADPSGSAETGRTAGADRPMGAAGSDTATGAGPR